MIIQSPTPISCIIEHIYADICDRFNYVIFVLAPIIVFSVVFRITYGWKAKKSVKMHYPGRFFKGQEIRMFVKKNIKFVKMTIEALLSMIVCQSISFLLFYFVCPWRSFAK
jgi:hypothetical protein